MAQFTKGQIPWNKGKVGYKNKGSFKNGHKLFGDGLVKYRDGGGKPWNKGSHETLNSGRTHFKKGQIPYNYKDGISKTVKYKNFYKMQYKYKKKTAGGSHCFGDWENLKTQYNYTCPSCGRSEPIIILTEDHIIPLSKGGSNNIENIQPLCKSCNSRKFTKIIKYG
jgi:hypothetical protein